MSCVLCLASKHIPWSAETRYIFVKSIDIDEESIAFDILRSPKSIDFRLSILSCIAFFPCNATSTVYNTFRG